MEDNWLQECDAQIAQKENTDRRTDRRTLIVLLLVKLISRRGGGRKTIDGRRSTDDGQRAP